MIQPSRTRRHFACGGLAVLLSAGTGCVSNGLISSHGPEPTMGIARAGDYDASRVIRAQSPERASAAQPKSSQNTKSKPSHQTKLVSHEGVPVSSGMMADGTWVGTAPGGYCPPGYEHGHHGIGVPVPGVPCPVPHFGLGMGYPGSSYTYKDPGVPVYPPGTGPALTGPGSPAAVVQYPYYTTKGPDCFFLDQDGRY